MSTVTPEATPLPVIANISRVVSKVVDRIMGDRVDYPLMVCAAVVEALKLHSIESRLMYGQVAWIEILEDQTPVWAGCWNGNIHFWVATQFGEVVDLNTSVAHRKRAHDNPMMKAMFSPPMIWSVDVPNFYRFVPEGVAELELTEKRDVDRYELVLAEIREKCGPQFTQQNDEADLDFANEPILCPGRKLLDDSVGSFKQFDRALGVRGMPKAPF